MRQLTLLAATFALVGCGGSSVEGEVGEVISDELSACASIPLGSATGSAEQVGNAAANAIDGNPATRWSGYGKGASLTVDLRAKKVVCSVSMGWYRSLYRSSSFTLALSTDGVTFNTVFTGQSRRGVTGRELYDFPDAPARYVRLTVNGNNENDWASVNELRVQGGEEQATTAAFTFSPSAPVAGQAVRFDATSSTCAATPCTFTWTDEPAGGGVYALGTGQGFSFTFQVAGTKAVNLVVTDAAGATSRAKRDVVVGNGTPAAAACADGADNDGDGKTDYPADPGCSSANDTDETDATTPPPPAVCADGKDNDGDGLTDFPADPGCASATDTDESNAVTPPPPSGNCDLNATPADFASKISAATAGQVVCLATGSYGTWQGTTKAITVRAAAGASPSMKVAFAGNASGFTLEGMVGMGGTLRAGATNVTIRGCTFSSALDAGGALRNVVLDRNTHNWMVGPTCGGGNAKIFVNVQGTLAAPALTVQNSDIQNGDLDGIHIGGGSGLLILNNNFKNLCDATIQCPGGGDSNHTDNIQFEGGREVRIAGNYFYAGASCPTQGVTSFDSGTVGVIIEDNVVDIRRPWGIELYSDRDSIVRHNTVRWYADADCDFNGIECGQIDISRKSADPAGSGTRVYDNIATSVGFNAGSTGTQNNNVSGKTATFVGPLTQFSGFKLTTTSPVGRNTASDGLNAGVRVQ